MVKGNQTLLILFLAAASMLLLLLYLPWESPYLYNDRGAFYENQGVNFKNINIKKGIIKVVAIKSSVGWLDSIGSVYSIANAPKSGRIDGSRYAEFNETGNYWKRKSGSKISSANYTGLDLTSNIIIYYNKIPTLIDAKKEGSSVRLNANANKITNVASSTNQSINSIRGLLSSNNFKNSSVGGALNKAVVNSSTSTLLSNPNDLNLVGSLQKVSAEDPPVGPGEEEDPPVGPGEEIPVSDGWGFLLLLAVIYIVVKRNFFSQFVSNKSIS